MRTPQRETTRTRYVWLCICLAFAVVVILVTVSMLRARRKEQRNVTAYQAMLKLGAECECRDATPYWYRRLIPGARAPLECTYVDLTDCRVRDRDLLFLSHLSGLTDVCLKATNIGDDGVRHLLAIEQLQVLSLESTPITDRALATLAEIRSLRHLYLDGTAVSDNGMVFLNGMHQLETLSLRNTRVSDIGMSRLHALRSLRDLDLGGTRVGASDMSYLKNFDNLDWFRVNGTSFNDSHLRFLEKATRLNIADTDVTDEGLMHLQGRRLELVIEGSQVTREGVRRILDAGSVVIPRDYYY